MRILVTGATGFLGSRLTVFWSEQGHDVTGVGSADCDLTRSDSLDQFNDVAFDRIVHLAAWTQAGEFCLHHPGEQWIINQRINTNMLAWWQTRQPQAKLLCMGTSCAYDPQYPLREEYYLRGLPIESLYTYAMTKRMLLVGLVAVRKQYGLKYLCLVPSTLYGPGYHTDGRQMHFIFDLIRKILRGQEFGEPVVLWGDGNQKRELVYLDDFVDILDKLAETTSNAVVNVGEGREHSIREYAEAICNIVGYPPEAIQYDVSRYVGAKSKVLDDSLLNTLYPNRPRTPLAAGLRRVIDWFLETRAHDLGVQQHP